MSIPAQAASITVNVTAAKQAEEEVAEIQERVEIYQRRENCPYFSGPGSSKAIVRHFR
jgi:hypothetical protein